MKVDEEGNHLPTKATQKWLPHLLWLKLRHSVPRFHVLSSDFVLSLTSCHALIRLSIKSPPCPSLVICALHVSKIRRNATT